MSVYYVVQVLRPWDSLAAGPFRIARNAAAPGCIGFLPVFETSEAATKWREENHPEAGIVAVTEDAKVPV